MNSMFIIIFLKVMISPDAIVLNQSRKLLSKLRFPQGCYDCTKGHTRKHRICKLASLQNQNLSILSSSSVFLAYEYMYLLRECEFDNVTLHHENVYFCLYFNGQQLNRGNTNILCKCKVLPHHLASRYGCSAAGIVWLMQHLFKVIF